MVWWFERGTEQLSCEVRRNAATYDIVVRRSDGTRVVTPVATPQELLHRMETIPRSLLYGGWRPRGRDEYSLRTGTGAMLRQHVSREPPVLANMEAHPE